MFKDFCAKGKGKVFLKNKAMIGFCTAALLAGVIFYTCAGDAARPSREEGLFPDLRTVVPQQVQIVNEHQRDILRFSNGIANTGEGPWRMRPVFPDANSLLQDAVQEILDADGQVVLEKVVSQFEFHEQHNHWHIDDVAVFEVRAGSLSGPLIRSSGKTTFCLIDWYQLDDNSPTVERTYFECNADYQGISPGWVDQYHQSTEGQQLDITGAAPGLYYLISTANPDGTFLETTLFNNTAWVSFELRRDSNGNPKITLIDQSPCDSPSMCGEGIPNR